jgi:nicotinate-nucleotide pyrophosphorylase (carboxylating)
MDWKSKRVRTILEAALAEDKVANDITTALTIDPGLRASGTIIAKQACVVAGLGCIPVFLDIFAKMSTGPVGRFEVVSHPEIFDGVKVKKGQTLAVIRHNAAAILSCERVILNLMQRMSGIATLTNEFVKAVAGTKTKVLDTRKTIPGLRALDKYAVSCGGGVNHRLDLQDGILIKNNHISLGGGLPAVLERALKGRKTGQVVQVEVRSQTELEQAIAGGAESILLDNMTPSVAKKAVKQIRAALPNIPIEASGSMNLKTVRDYALAGVDFVSVGALTHSATAVDLSMRITADIF